MVDDILTKEPFPRLMIIISIFCGGKFMELQCKIAVNAAKENIWPYYIDSSKRSIWEEDLEKSCF